MRSRLFSAGAVWQKNAAMTSALTQEPAGHPVPLADGIAAHAENYDGFILDLWGVLHDGERAYPAATDCLAALKRLGKKLLILSNAPRRAEAIVARNEELGITRDLYDVIHSSGEETWIHLKDRPDAWYRSLGSRVFHLGPSRDNGIREGLDLSFVDDLADADVILNTGASAPEEQVEDFEPLLQAALDRRLPMICANPDLVVMRGSRLEICAGAIAARYQDLGGQVRYHGKPHADVYQRSFRLLGLADKARVAAVGDSLRTDVAGAAAAGIDAIFVTGGIHVEELDPLGNGRPDAERLNAAIAQSGHRPVAAVPAFTW